MEKVEQIQILRRMLADAEQLAQAGDPLVSGLHTTIDARLRLLLVLHDAEDVVDDASI